MPHPCKALVEMYPEIDNKNRIENKSEWAKKIKSETSMEQARSFVIASTSSRGQLILKLEYMNLTKNIAIAMGSIRTSSRSKQASWDRMLKAEGTIMMNAISRREQISCERHCSRKHWKVSKQAPSPAETRSGSWNRFSRRNCLKQNPRSHRQLLIG